VAESFTGFCIGLLGFLFRAAEGCSAILIGTLQSGLRTMVRLAIVHRKALNTLLKTGLH